MAAARGLARAPMRPRPPPDGAPLAHAPRAEPGRRHRSHLAAGAGAADHFHHNRELGRAVLGKGRGGASLETAAGQRGRGGGAYGGSARRRARIGRRPPPAARAAAAAHAKAGRLTRARRRARVHTRRWSGAASPRAAGRQPPARGRGSARPRGWASSGPSARTRRASTDAPWRRLDETAGEEWGRGAAEQLATPRGRVASSTARSHAHGPARTRSRLPRGPGAAAGAAHSPHERRARCHARARQHLPRARDGEGEVQCGLSPGEVWGPEAANAARRRAATPARGG